MVLTVWLRLKNSIKLLSCDSNQMSFPFAINKYLDGEFLRLCKHPISPNTPAQWFQQSQRELVHSSHSCGAFLFPSFCLHLSTRILLWGCIVPFPPLFVESLTYISTDSWIFHSLGYNPMRSLLILLLNLFQLRPLRTLSGCLPCAFDIHPLFTLSLFALSLSGAHF